jgi:filamentous hemagglutinin
MTRHVPSLRRHSAAATLRASPSIGSSRPPVRLSAIGLAVSLLISGQDAGAFKPGDILPRGLLPSLQGVTSGQATVRAPVPTATGNLLSIDQQSQTAIIQWNSFNIASGSEVRFNQPNQGASVLNRIFDLDPSIIQGKLTANGQVYLLNQNGILFDRGSQVNVHTLVASTLGLTDDMFNSRINANSDPAAIEFQGVTGYTRIDVGSFGPPGAAQASITTASGGSVILLAPQVTNNGVITAPNGQVILAAGNTVLLFQPLGQDPNQMRGLFVEVTADKQPLNLTSLVSNLGTIRADRGNVTLAGLAVNQMGTISAKQAVNQNGSIWLIASDTAKLGPASVTETQIDTSDTTTLADNQDFSVFRPSIRVEGNTIIDQGQIPRLRGTSPFKPRVSASPIF